MNETSPYHEKLLHWIWGNRKFRVRNLLTADDQKVCIHNPGTLNKSDGPDFTSAEITIGNLRWYGDVELHWQLSDWNHHKHHTDANYNNVILHVVFAQTKSHSFRKDDTAIPTLCLRPYLSQPLKFFLNQYQKNRSLPCSGSLSYISKEVFAQQLEKAHKEYFEQKVDILLNYYDSSLPPSNAWQKMLITGLWDGLGIAHNRDPMRKLAYHIIDNNYAQEAHSKNDLRIKCLKSSGINSGDHPKIRINWKHKGCRPGNHPRHRIQQGAELLWDIRQHPFEQWMQTDPKTLWNGLLNSIETRPGLGKERASILFGTVFLPSLYFLGNLFFINSLKKRCWILWKNHEANIPTSLLNLLHNTEIPPATYQKKLGAIYQLRNYCRPKNCQACKIFKSIIST